MIPRRVRIAFLIAFICHGFFILTARYRISYDAYTHMLFANHYAENWFSLWETRWYTGFTVVSYPPLTHQLIALFVPILGFDKAYAFILWIVTSLYPLGVYAFSRIFTGKTSASYAALGSAILLPIYVTAYIFGQLPFITSTLTALFAAASLNRYLKDGGVHNFALSVALITTSMAMHHATLMVQPFLIFAVIVNVLFRHRDIESRSVKFFLSVISASPWLVLFRRIAIFVISACATCLLVIFPFWQWGSAQTMQTPIDHLSRHNFLIDPLAFAIFFFPLYGLLFLIIPFLFRKWHPRFTGLLASFTILFLLGLGGTTPLPYIIFGDAWEWLTMDRFAFWASLTLTPFFGILFIRLKKRFATKPTPASPRKNLFQTLTFSLFTFTALGAWFTPILFPTQPKTIDMQPIVDFLDTGDNSQWRYLTFGFGDQFAYLNLLTTTTTIDGSYHTARTLPELRESGIGQVDTAYWALKGIPAIAPILKKSGDHGVRWGFVNKKDFIPELKKDGWVYRQTLSNGIQVWENPKAILPKPSIAPVTPAFTSFAWGTFPILAFVITLLLGTLRMYPVQAEWVIRKIHSFAITLLPLTLCFWLYRVIGDFSHPRVYFTYDNALFFLSDAIVLLAITLWATTRLATHKLPITNYRLPIALCILIILSTLWSRDWRTSLYISLHFWLIFLLILSLRDWHESWKFAMFGLCAALSVQLVAGFTGFALQSTAFLEPLDMKWPGILDPSVRGASIVQLPGGESFLRAYGTLPHPNILGGFIFVTLLGSIALFFDKERTNWLSFLLIIPGISLLALTFSRSAWLALIAFFIILILKSKHFPRKQLVVLLVISGLSFVLALLPYRQLVQARTMNMTSHSEEFSLIGRAWLNSQALEMIRERPGSGMGIGSFIIALSQRAGEGYIIEPVHNIFLLAGSELGIPGLLLVLALFFSVGLNIIKSRSPQAILAGATLTGLGVISLFDHYLWTLAPGRVMFGLALGLWAGQVKHDA